MSATKCKVFIGLTIRVEMISGGRPLQRENLAHADPLVFKTTTFDLFSPVAWAVTLSEKSSINIRRKSILRAFQWAQDEHRTLSLSPSNGGGQ